MSKLFIFITIIIIILIIVNQYKCKDTFIVCDKTPTGPYLNNFNEISYNSENNILYVSDCTKDKLYDIYECASKQLDMNNCSNCDNVYYNELSQTLSC
jgi:hypothetical protein